MGRGNRGPCSFALRVGIGMLAVSDMATRPQTQLETVRMFILWVHHDDSSISKRVILPILQEVNMT